MTEPEDWQRRVDEVWARSGSLGDAGVIGAIDDLASELDDEDPRAPFESAGARDSAGLEVEAEPRYREALRRGLAGRSRIECLIQLASTVRNLGRPEEALALLDEADRTPYDLGDAIAAFRALALVDAGDARRAASVAVTALSTHLPQYGRAARAYALELR